MRKKMSQKQNSKIMKNKIVFAAAVVVVAAVVSASVAWMVAQFTDYQPLDRAPSSEFAGAGAHFTAYTADGYPDLTYAAENAVKAVVSVIKTEEIPVRSHPFFDFFGIQGGQDQQGGLRQQTSGGSGVIISEDGYIVTNHHVVVNASKLTVKLPDGKTYDARLVGTDEATEVALVKIDERGLPALRFGSSDELRLGEWVLAIGNPYELRSTITAGIVSAKARSLGVIQTAGNAGVEAFIQTDAAVNPGNSGGALVNAAGELVGINTLILSRTGSYSGYSFAVPETIVRKVVSDLREYGVVQRAIIGISYIVDDENRIVVREVPKGGAAHAAGVEAGDILTHIDGREVTSSAVIAEALSQKRPGDRIKISIKRGEKVKQIEVVLRNSAGKSELLTR